MRVGILLLGPFPERQVYAAASIARSLRAEADGTVEVEVFTTDSQLAGRSMPGADLALRVVASAPTDDPGAHSADSAFQTGDYLSLADTAAKECDAWILVDENTGFPLSMTRPTLLWVPEFTDRHVGGAIPDRMRGWAFARRAAFANRIAAQRVAVHDDKAWADARYFAQIPESRLVRLPWPLPPDPAPEPVARPRASPYVFWHLAMENTAVIDAALEAIELYLGPYFGQCALVVGGAPLGGPDLPVPARNEAAFAEAVRARIADRSWSGLVHYAGIGGVQDLIDWGGHAEAVILGRGWRANQPLQDLLRRQGRPALVLGGARHAGFARTALPDLHVLDDPAAAAVFLKRAEQRRPDAAAAPPPGLPSPGTDWHSVVVSLCGKVAA